MRRKIGSGLTNSDGVASCSYTGKAVGKMDVIAEFTNDGSTVVSQPLTVIDGVFYDDATTQQTTKWNNYGASATYGSDGTTLTTSTDYRYQPYLTFDEDMAIEFDLYIPSTTSSNPNLYVRGLSPYFSAEWFPRNVWHHLKVTCRNGDYDLYSDGERKVGGTYNVSNKIFQFRTSENATLTFKNFVAYPI